MDLKGKIVVVTGGGNGIGRAICQRIAHESPKAVIVADIDLAAAEEVAGTLGVIARARFCDVSQESVVQSVVESIEAEVGPIDLFCANAGIALGEGIDTELADWQKIIDVNLMSHVYAARAVVPRMAKRGHGYILHTSSAAGLLTEVSSAPYSVTKHGVVALAEWLAIQYGDQGVRVSCLCPQGVRTAMLDGIDSPSAKMLRETSLSAEEVAEVVVAAIEEEKFLVLPHPEVEEYFQRKASDYDRWLDGMRRLKHKIQTTK